MHKKKSSSNISTITKEESNAGEEKEVTPFKKKDEKEVTTSKKKDVKGMSASKKEESNTGEEKGVTKSKKMDEIDEIFSSKKRKNPEKEKVEKSGGTNEKPKMVKKKKSKFPILRQVEPESRPRRRTNDGLVIYSADELGFNKQDAGGTRLCPFDCSCCF